jgi:hypothetical protein
MTTPNMTSVRLTILNAMVTSFQNMAADQPTNDPYGVTFSTVALGPLADYDQRKRYSLGVVAGPEKETFTIPYITCWLQVNVEFRVTVNRDDTAPGVMIEQLLTIVKRRLTEDRTWGALAIDTKVIGSEIDLVTYADRSAVGVCVAEVQYRYSHLDPRDPRPDF